MPRFPDMPDRLARLAVDHRGYPVPWFVAWMDGSPDFRVIHPAKLGEAWKGELCWVCGQKLGAYRAWVMGPISIIEAAAAEPPTHLDCGQFAARNCPFLANPRMRRNGKDLPDLMSPGVMVEDNSEATALWITKGRGAQPFQAGKGVLFKLAAPARIEWYARGREAKTEEVRAALDQALPILSRTAEAEGRAAVIDLDRRLQSAIASISGVAPSKSSNFSAPARQP